MTDFTLNTFQVRSIRKLAEYGVNAKPRGNWLHINGMSVMSAGRVDEICACLSRVKDAESGRGGILGTVKSIRNGVVTLT